MKLSKNFVKDYIDIDVDIKTLAEDMTRVGNEYDSAEKLINATKLIIGEVLECEDHPDSDHLHVCKVDIGEEVLDIVCGAPNVRKGLKVIVALDGAVLPGDFKIKKGNKAGKIVLEKNCILKPAVQNKYKHDFPIALFEVSNVTCQKGTEFDQMAEILAIAALILKTERKIREQLADNSRTVILNFVKQSYAKCAYSLLLEYNEALSIISALKFGLHCKFIAGIDDNTLNSMIYKLKQNHLDCLTQSYKFEFEDDIKNNKILQIQRLRAVILQETIEKIQFTC